MTGFAQGDVALAPGAVSVGSPRQINSEAAAITFLRNNGVLAAGNSSSATSGIYASDTGEIRLDIAAKQMRVVTPHTEAVAFASVNQPISLGQMTVWSASGASLFAVSSLDGQAVAQSSKLLIVMATNARNTGMTFSDAEQKIVSNYGALPVEIKVEWVQFSIPTDRPWRISLSISTGWYSHKSCPETDFSNRCTALEQCFLPVCITRADDIFPA